MSYWWEQEALKEYNQQNPQPAPVTPDYTRTPIEKDPQPYTPFTPTLQVQGQAQAAPNQQPDWLGQAAQNIGNLMPATDWGIVQGMYEDAKQRAANLPVVGAPLQALGDVLGNVGGAFETYNREVVNPIAGQAISGIKRAQEPLVKDGQLNPRALQAQLNAANPFANLLAPALETTAQAIQQGRNPLEALQTEGKQKFEQLSVPEQIIGGIVFDPLNLLPGAGLRKAGEAADVAKMTKPLDKVMNAAELASAEAKQIKLPFGQVVEITTPDTNALKVAQGAVKQLIHEFGNIDSLYDTAQGQGIFNRMRAATTGLSDMPAFTRYGGQGTRTEQALKTMLEGATPVIDKVEEQARIAELLRHDMPVDEALLKKGDEFLNKQAQRLKAGEITPIEFREAVRSKLQENLTQHIAEKTAQLYGKDPQNAAMRFMQVVKQAEAINYIGLNPATNLMNVVNNVGMTLLEGVTPFTNWTKRYEQLKRDGKVGEAIELLRAQDARRVFMEGSDAVRKAMKQPAISGKLMQGAYGNDLLGKTSRALGQIADHTLLKAYRHFEDSSRANAYLHGMTKFLKNYEVGQWLKRSQPLEDALRAAGRDPQEFYNLIRDTAQHGASELGLGKTAEAIKARALQWLNGQGFKPVDYEKAAAWLRTNRPDKYGNITARGVREMLADGESRVIKAAQNVSDNVKAGVPANQATETEVQAMLDEAQQGVKARAGETVAESFDLANQTDAELESRLGRISQLLEREKKKVEIEKLQNEANAIADELDQRQLLVNENAPTPEPQPIPTPQEAVNGQEVQKAQEVAQPEPLAQIEPQPVAPEAAPVAEPTAPVTPTVPAFNLADLQTKAQAVVTPNVDANIVKQWSALLHGETPEVGQVIRARNIDKMSPEKLQAEAQKIIAKARKQGQDWPDAMADWYEQRAHFLIDQIQKGNPKYSTDYYRQRLENGDALMRLVKGQGYDWKRFEATYNYEPYKPFDKFYAEWRANRRPSVGASSTATDVGKVSEPITPASATVGGTGSSDVVAQAAKRNISSAWDNAPGVGKVGEVGKPLKTSSRKLNNAMKDLGYSAEDIKNMDDAEKYAKASQNIRKPVAPAPQPVAPKEAWQMTRTEFEKAKQGENFGDWFTTPDGKFIQMRGGGGLGSNRVGTLDVNGEFAGYYNRDELKLVRQNNFTSESSVAADKWLGDVSSRVAKLKKDNETLLLKSGIYDRFKRALDSGEITKEKFLALQKDGTLISDAKYKKAQKVKQQIEDARNTNLVVPENKAHKASVEKALAEGKPVPPEVLSDYPDLAPKAPVAETTRATTIKIGETAKDIYKNWQNAEGNVVGVIHGYGVFDWQDGKIWRVNASTRNKIATRRLATKSELAEIDNAINNGTIQIERRPTTGVISGQGGQGTTASADTKTQVLHQATGKPLVESTQLPPESTAGFNRAADAGARPAPVSTADQETVNRLERNMAINAKIADMNIDELYRQFIKPGDVVSIYYNRIKVKKVNKVSIEAENGLKYKFDELKPLRPDGTFYSQDEIRKILLDREIGYLDNLPPESFGNMTKSAGGGERPTLDELARIAQAQREQWNATKEKWMQSDNPALAGSASYADFFADLTEWFKQAYNTTEPPREALRGTARQAALDYLKTEAIPAWNDGKIAAQIHAKSLSDAVMLNMDTRYKYVDDALQFLTPFPMWQTRYGMEMIRKVLDKPALLAWYLHLRDAFQQNENDPAYPKRLQGLTRISLPFVSNAKWLGDWFIDPLETVMPIQQVFRLKPPYQDQLTNEDIANTIRNLARSGNITPAQATEAIAKQDADPIWQNTKESMTAALGDNSPMSDILGGGGVLGFKTHLPYQIAWNALTGTPNEVGQIFPWLRNGALALMAGGLGKQLPLDASLQAKVDKQLAQMAAQGEITPEQAAAARLERTGDAYQTALQRAGIQGVSEMPLYGKFFPQGEKSYYAARIGRDQILDQEVARLGGNPAQMSQDQKWAFFSANKGFTPDSAMAKYYDAHPELGAFSDLYKQPEQLYQNVLKQDLWNAYMGLSTLQKKLVRTQLGEEFQTLFLDKGQRNYDAIPLPMMLGWAKALGIDTPNPAAFPAPTPDPYRVKLATPDQDQRYQAFYDSIANSVGWDNFYKIQTQYYALPAEARAQFKKANPVLTQVWDAQRKFYAANPDIDKLLQQYGDKAPSTQQQATTLGGAFSQAVEASLGWANVEKLKAQYDQLPKGTGARTQFLNANPLLRRYFELAGAFYGNSNYQANSSPSYTSNYSSYTPRRYPGGGGAPTRQTFYSLFRVGYPKTGKYPIYAKKKKQPARMVVKISG